MFCRNCGKEIADGAAFCQECGAAQKETTSPPISNSTNPDHSANQSSTQKGSYNMLCVIGFVLSGISLFIDFRGMIAIAGTVLSVVGLINCKQKNEKGKVFAIIGIVVGVSSIILTAIFTAMALSDYTDMFKDMFNRMGEDV